MKRSVLVKAIERELGRRSLVWFGTRADDVDAATDIRNLDTCFALIGSLGNRPPIESKALEDITHRRFDLDTYDIDDDDAEAVDEFRVIVMRALARRSALFAYRPNAFLSNIAFVRQEHCRYLGMFRGHQAPFEHKPWIETNLRDLGIPMIPWRYVASSEKGPELLARGPVMLRPSRTTGGVGLTRVDRATDLDSLWPETPEGFVGVSPFIEQAIPINIGGVIWNDGVTLHHPSIQLVGIEGATTRPFGYCGNDFSAISELPPVLIDSLERNTLSVSQRLRTLGYLGAFGVDYLVRDGVPIFAEVNARFQGSTHLSSRISADNGESCILTEHIGAFLGFPAPPHRPLREVVVAQPHVSHLVLHHRGPDAQVLDPRPLIRKWRELTGSASTDVLTRPDLITEPGATIARLTVAGSLTADGFTLRPEWIPLVQVATDSEAPQPRGAPPWPSTSSLGRVRNI